MLNTPIGKIEIYIDGRKIDYTEVILQPDKYCPNVKGRYKIELAFIPDGNKHIISCILNSNFGNIEENIESGERLECKGFYYHNMKLSIGMEGDAGYIGSERISDYGYDYDTEYIDNGVQYIILTFTKTKKYVFGIAWIDNPNKKREIQTWLGADPTMME